MPCTTAYLIRKPKIEEVFGRPVFVYYYTGPVRWKTHYEPQLVPTYRVTFTYDYGFCCGVDYNTVEYATKEEAEAAIQEVYDNKHKYIKYDEEYLEDEDGDDN